jgi:hypothetical protein
VWQLTAFSGLALAVLFHAGFALPLRTGIVAMALLTIWGIWTSRVSALSLLPRFMIVLYSLPFAVLVGYLMNPDYIWMFTPRGLDIIEDHLVIRQMVMVGLIGLLGLIAGMRWAALRRPGPGGAAPMIVQRSNRTLSAPIFYALVPVAVLFSWLSAPPETILETTYASGQSDAVAATINFPAAYMVSYVLLVILFIDAERERRAAWRRTKFLAVGLATAYIVIVLQLLRGDRESSGLVVALTALYVTSPAGVRQARRLASIAKSRIRRLMIPMAGLVAVFIALGSLRGTLSQASAVAEVLSPVEAVELGLSQNTWTAVLWTNLSVAWEHRQGLLQYKYGQTYVDYALSLPPGVVTKALGYERPLEGWRGIAWEDAAGVSSGGLHVVVAPFRNFGAFGVFAILMLYGFFIARIEQRGESGPLGARVLWGSVFCGSFLWFWYGDMSFIRALMMAGLAYIGYRIALSIQWTTPRSALPDGVYARQ